VMREITENVSRRTRGKLQPRLSIW